MTAAQKRALRENIWNAPFERLRSKPIPPGQVSYWTEMQREESRMFAQRRREEEQERYHARVLAEHPDDPFFVRSIEIDKQYGGDATATFIAQVHLCLEEYNRDRNQRLVLLDGAGIGA